GAALAAVTCPMMRALVARTAAPAPRPGFMRPGSVLVLLSLLAFCSQFAEGSAETWSSGFVADSAGISARLAGIGFSAYALSMFCGRMAGDALLLRFGPVATVRCL